VSAPVELVQTSPGRYEVRGALTFATAAAAHQAGRKNFSNSDSQTFEVDCSGVSAADSAGLAVLLDWMAFAKSRGRQLHFVGLPEELLALARISEVEDWLKQGA
jgi:phospholipid transport system transporter-binding protein